MLLTDSARPEGCPDFASAGHRLTAAPRPAVALCRLAAATVCAATGISVDDILAPRRAPAAAASARQLAMYLAHVGFGVALADVARAFRRDRTTVAYACRRIEDLRDGPFDQEVARLEACARWAAGG